MAYESGRTLQPIYLDSVTKGKYTRDEATGEIIGKIMANIKIDAAFIYGEQLMKPATEIFGDIIAERDRNFEGRYARQKTVISVSLSEFKRVLEAATGGE